MLERINTIASLLQLKQKIENGQFLLTLGITGIIISIILSILLSIAENMLVYAIFTLFPITAFISLKNRKRIEQPIEKDITSDISLLILFLMMITILWCTFCHCFFNIDAWILTTTFTTIVPFTITMIIGIKQNKKIIANIGYHTLFLGILLNSIMKEYLNDVRICILYIIIYTIGFVIPGIIVRTNSNNNNT